jgi:hypothetical protein
MEVEKLLRKLIHKKKLEAIMKKLIQICSVLTLVFAFSIISANAQTQRYEANVPFDFNIGGKSYTAGKYLLKIGRVPTGKILFIEDNNKKYLQTALVSEGGNVSKNNSILRFTRYADQWVLTNLMTAETGFNLPLSKSQKQIAKNQSFDSKAEAEIISIDLK